MSYWLIPGRQTTGNWRQNITDLNRQFQSLNLRMATPGRTGGFAVIAATETFIIDPFVGNINPGTTRGQKLFKETCSALDEADILTASIANQHAVMEHIMSLVQKFRWGPQVLAVSLVSDLTKTKSLITESFALSVEDLKVQAYKIWVMWC